MFNPKGGNILDEQLAVSGLEMNIDPFSAAQLGIQLTQTFLGIGQARSANAAARRTERKQQKLLNKSAKLQNKYNEKSFEAMVDNYRAMAEYNFDTAVENWQYNTAIRAIQERTDARKYMMSVKNTNKQLTYNAIAEQQGLTRSQLAINDARTEYAFNTQDVGIAQLVEQGRAVLGQAGRGMQKRTQSSAAAAGRNLAVLNASLTGEINEAHLSMFDIRAGRYAADARVEAARMLRPERLPPIPAPTKPPEPIFVEPMKVLPGMAAPAQQQNIAQLAIQGIGSAVNTAASIDWSSPNTDSLQPAPKLQSRAQAAGWANGQGNQLY